MARPVGQVCEHLGGVEAGVPALTFRATKASSTSGIGLTDRDTADSAGALVSVY